MELDKTKLDYFFNGTAHGSTAQRLLANNMDIGALRPYIDGKKGAYITTRNGQIIRVSNATLRHEEWLHIDQAVIKAVQDRLVGAADLIARGLTYDIPDGIGSPVIAYEDMSDVSDAEISMDGATRGRNDRPEYDINYMPLPLVHGDFDINTRVLAASRTTGMPLDTTMAELKGRKVAEKIESILFTGASTYTYGGGTLYGYMDHPDRNTYSLTADWNDSAATGETILADVLGMKQALIDAKYYGPYMLYVPTNFETALDEDLKANSDKTVRQRLLEVSGIEGIKVADKLTDDNVVLVQMTSDVVRLVQGLQPTTIEWTTQGGLMNHFKVMAIQVPQIRSDQDGNSGVCHGS